MTPTVESPSWRDLESGFRHLAESKPAEFPAMVANWEVSPISDVEDGEIWTFAFVPDERSYLPTFKRLCAEAAAKTGHPANHAQFLNLLTQQKPDACHPYGEGRGYIDRVCEVAADWCAEQAEKESHGTHGTSAQEAGCSNPRRE